VERGEPEGAGRQERKPSFCEQKEAKKLHPFANVTARLPSSRSRDLLFFPGKSPDCLLPENIERTDHPWLVGVQAQPELTGKPFAPHPLFRSFIEAAVKQARLVKKGRVVFSQ